MLKDLLLVFESFVKWIGYIILTIPELLGIYDFIETHALTILIIAFITYVGGFISKSKALKISSLIVTIISLFSFGKTN